MPFENKLTGLPTDVRERMVKGVEDFVYNMLINVLNSKDTAPLGIEAILKSKSYDLGPKVSRVENPSEWTKEKIVEKAKILSGKGAASGKDFSD
jgi:fructose-bisphosphate aldolase class II